MARPKPQLFLSFAVAGFAIAIPLLVFLYLKVQSGEPWALCLILTACAWLVFWGLFNRLLQLPFPDGYLEVWLDLSG